MKTIDLETKLLKPYELNSKKHDKEQINNVAESIKQFGWQQPIVVDKDYVIIIGHCRFEAAKQLKLETVPCIVADSLTEEQVKKLRVIDNKTNESDWDFDLLKQDICELNFDGFEIDWGIPEEESEEIEVTEDEFDIDAAVPEEPTAQRGDIYQLGNHRLMCGDSTSLDDVQKLMNGNKADMVFTDPPYGMKKENDGVANDNLNYDDLLEFNKKWIPLTFEMLKNNGSWYCWGIEEPLMDIYSSILKPKMRDRLIDFRNLIIWDKGSGQGQMSNMIKCYVRADELCLFVTKGMATMSSGQFDTAEFFYEGFAPIRNYLVSELEKSGITKKQVIENLNSTASHYFSLSQWQLPTEENYKKLQELTNYNFFRKEYSEIRKEYSETLAFFDNTHDNMNNVWRFQTTTGLERQEAGGHATPKPIALCSRAIKSSSRENEIVLDVFGGSGSTLIACEQLNRNAYLMELEPKWVDVIIKRWENLTGKKAIKIA